MFCDPTSTPTLLVDVVVPSHSCVLVAAVGPQMCHATEPLNEEIPVTPMVVLSLTNTFASAGAAGIDDAGDCVVSVASTGSVDVSDLHSPSAPRAKSYNVAVNDCEERVSPTNVLKHLPLRPESVRLTPPSKNSAVDSVWVSALPPALVSHGMSVMV